MIDKDSSQTLYKQYVLLVISTRGGIHSFSGKCLLCCENQISHGMDSRRLTKTEMIGMNGLSNHTGSEKSGIPRLSRKCIDFSENDTVMITLFILLILFIPSIL